MSVKIATWNVNSIKTRIEAVTNWLREAEPDVLCLQELKCEDKNFPRAPIEDLGYNLALFGQKTYNGVAVLSKTPATDPVTDIPSLDDPQRRILAVTVDGVRVEVDQGQPGVAPRLGPHRRVAHRVVSAEGQYPPPLVQESTHSLFDGTGYNLADEGVPIPHPHEDPKWTPQSQLQGPALRKGQLRQRRTFTNGGVVCRHLREELRRGCPATANACEVLLHLVEALGSSVRHHEDCFHEEVTR